MFLQILLNLKVFGKVLPFSGNFTSFGAIVPNFYLIFGHTTWHIIHFYVHFVWYMPS